MNQALRRVSLACLVMFLLLLVNANFVQAFQANKLAGDPGNGAKTTVFPLRVATCIPTPK